MKRISVVAVALITTRGASAVIGAGMVAVAWPLMIVRRYKARRAHRSGN